MMWEIHLDDQVRSFIAVDGEGIVDRYVILAASSGQAVTDPDGLSTLQCFEFLLNLEKPPRATYVGFFFTYDTNMMLKDIPLAKLRKLWQEKWLTWRGYQLEWTPTKAITIKRESPKATITIYDVGGFFQSSFVTALEKWEAAPPNVIARIKTMKDQRDTFTPEALREMLIYCMEECEYLVELMKKLEQALADTQLTPNKWMGAGSIAGKVLTKHGVSKYRQSDTAWGSHIHEGILHGYFGGRVELFLQGYHREAASYDVVSAYPYAAMLLPSLEGDFTRVEQLPRFGLSRVSWALPPDTLVCPFPFRYKHGIYWPTSGSGWYHAVEVREAVKHYGEFITIHENWELETDGSTRPFTFIADYFKARAEFKRTGNAAEKAIKLGLNSLYGKLAQGIGYRGRPPAHRSYLWAGAITANCRARMLSLAMEAGPENVIMVATDGIFLRSDPGWKEGTNLGDLERAHYPSLFTAQPGVYVAEGDRVINKTRGFSVKEVTFDALKEAYDRSGPFGVCRYRSRRFQGLGSSLQRKTMDGWLTWPESDRKLSLYPSRKWVDIESTEQWENEPQPYVIHHPPAMNGMSEPYSPKTADLSIPGSVEYAELQEQPDPGASYHIKPPKE